MIEESRPADPAPSPSGPLAIEPLADECTIDDFQKVDLRVARVISAEDVAGADKLLRLQVDIGGQQRELLAGIKQAYQPDTLIGRKVIIVANLKPRKMKFGTSEGMVAAAGPGGKNVFLLAVDDGAEPGHRVH